MSERTIIQVYNKNARQVTPNTYIPSLDEELDIVPKLESPGDALGLGEVEEYLVHHVGPLNESVRVLNATHDALVLHWLSWIF